MWRANYWIGAEQISAILARALVRRRDAAESRQKSGLILTI
jgi:hypothetical protein